MIPTNIYIWSKNTVFNGLYKYLNKYFVYCVSGVGNSGPPLRTFTRANIGLITLIIIFKQIIKYKIFYIMKRSKFKNESI